MIFTPIPLAGAYLIDLEKKEDERGFFSRAICQKEFGAQGLIAQFCQINDSFSARSRTLRGMHYQLAPMAETKLVRCVRGAIYDLILDVRPDSATFGQSYGVELSGENRRMIYLPKGFAQGSFTLVDDTETFYFVDQWYSPEHERGIRYNDPKFDLPWPGPPIVISDKDEKHPDFDSSWHLGA
jgi:dTDP-4-dehydrorhamnose 3,5-epimerase